VRARVSVEEASDFGCSKYTGSEGHNVCIETFGASAPLKQLLKKFGFSAEKIVAAAKSQIAQHHARAIASHLSWSGAGTQSAGKN